MNNETKKGKLVPELRFPGFEGEWDYVNGNELFEPISNKEHDSDLPILALTQEQGAVPRDEINYKVIVSDKSIASYKVVEVDDFIISLRSFQGGIEYSRYKGLCSPAYIVLRKKNKNLCSDFYRIYFKSFNYIQELNKKLEGIRDGKMISYKQFSEIKLPVPSLPEQQKIAECLSSVDDLIQAEADQLQALKDHKKGLMQQLFPQEGETTPKLRFPGFKGEWEEKKLGEVCDITAGGDVPKQKFSKEKTNIFNIPIISNGVGDNSIYGYTDFPKITKKAVTVAARGTIGYSEYRDYPYYPIIRLLSVVSKDSTILDTKFLSFILSLQKYDVADAGIPQLTVPMISSITISFPSLPEQQKIADCFSSLDEGIAAQQEKVEALKEHKKGLMQKLFPNLQ